MSRFLIEKKELSSIKKSITFDRSFAIFDLVISVKKKEKLKDIQYFTDIAGWIIGVGSCIYKHKIGSECLKDIYTDFKGIVDIPSLKKSIWGMYSLCIYKYNQLYVLNDYYGLYDVIYNVDNDNCVITNNIADINIDKSCPLNEFPLILTCFGNGNFSSEEIIYGYKRLQGNEFIVINDVGIEVNKIDITDYKISIPNYENLDQALSYLLEQIDFVVNDINTCYGDVDLCMTGGLDSRLVLGSFIHNANNVNHLLYGDCKTYHIPTCKEDKMIVDHISRLTNISFLNLDWNPSEKDDIIDMEWQRKLYEKVGFNNCIYLGDKNFVESLTNNSNLSALFIEFGYFLEAIRLREWVESKNSDSFSLDEYLERYFSIMSNINYSKASIFKDWLKDLFKEKTSDLCIDDYTKIPIELVNKVEWVFRERITDSRMHLFLNHYLYAFPIFSLPYIHEFILNIPNDMKKRGRFQIQLIKALKSDLLNAQIFSHRRLYRINNSDEKVLSLNFKNIFTRLGGVLPVLYKKILPYYQSIRYKKSYSDDNFLRIIMELKEDKIPNINLENYSGSKNSLFKFRQLLLALSFKNSIEF